MRSITSLLSVLVILLTAQLALATNYTWNGGTSSDWGTATNWTPNGVPGASDNVTIVSAGTAPVYDGVAGVTAFNMYSGSLDLNGYTLSISGQGYFSGGTVSNGVIDANGTITYFFGGVLNAKVDVNSAKPYLNGATFNDSLIFEVTGNGAQSNGGNVFNGPVIMTNSGAYTPYYGHLNPDTFNNHLHIYNTGTGALTLAGSNDDHYFADTVFINSTSGQGIYFGNAGVDYEMAGPLLVGDSGFSAGTLTLRNFIQANSDDFDLTLTGTAKISIEDCEFAGDLTLNVPYIELKNSTFNGELDLTRSGTSNNNVYGGNLFNDSVTVSNTGNNMIMAISAPDTFNYLAVFRNEGAGGLTVGYGTAGNEFNADVKVYNLTGSSAFSFQPFGASGSTTFDGDVYVNSKSTGGVGFGPGNTPTLTMTAGHTIAVGDTGFIAGTLTIRRFEQEGSAAMSLTLTDAANIKLQESEIGGYVYYNGPGFIIDDMIFNEDVYFIRDTTANEQLLGSNTYHGDATFINNGTGYLMWRTSDTYHGDATFIATSTGDLKPGNYSTNTFKGNIHANNPSEVSFGLDYAGSKVVLDGDGVQTLTCDSASGIIGFRDLQVDKSQGFVVIERDLSILDSLILTDGIIYTDTFIIEVKNDAEAVGAADSSYVEGIVKKTGNDAFTFPVGRDGHYKPIAISAPSSTTAEFVGEYWNENSNDDYTHSSKDGTINRLSTNEYWNLDRTSSTNTVSVTISWEEMSCVLDTLANLRVAAWNGSQWKDLGNGGTTGDTASGTIVTNGASTVYGPYTVATVDTFRCVPCMADAGEDLLLFSGQEGQLGADVISGYTYNWSPTTGLSQADTSDPFITIVNSDDTTISTFYELTVENSQGCEATDEALVSIVNYASFPIDSTSFSSTNPNYYSICERMDAYFTAHPPDSTEEDGAFAKYRRWQIFWKDRVDFVGEDDRVGDIDYATDVYQLELDLSSDTSNICMSNTGIDQDWEPLGPMSMATANQGLVPGIFVDEKTNGDIIVYAGTRAGGIFKSTNPHTSSPATWECLMDPKKMPSLGCQSISVFDGSNLVPAKPYNIVAGSWTKMDLQHSNYRFGVIYSLNGGDTWAFSQFEGSDPTGAYAEDFSHRVVKIIRHPANDSILYAVTPYALYRSQDYGAHFRHIRFNVGEDLEDWVEYGFTDMEVDSRAGSSYENILYLSGVKPVIVNVPNGIPYFSERIPVIYKLEITDNTQSTAIPTNLAENLTEYDDYFDRVLIEHVGGDLSAFYLNDNCTESDVPVANHHQRRSLVDISYDEGATFTNIYEGHTNESNCPKENSPHLSPAVFSISAEDPYTIYVEGRIQGANDRGRAVVKITEDIGGGYSIKSCNWVYWPPDGPGDTHGDIRDIHVVEFSEDSETDELFVAHDGGISYSKDGTGSGQSYQQTWHSINGYGLNNSEFFNVSAILDKKGRSHYSAQDNGHIDYNVGQNGLFEVDAGITADGYERFFNQNNLTFKNDHHNKTITPYDGPDGNQFFSARMETDGSNNLYHGCTNIYKWDFDVAATSQTSVQVSNLSLPGKIRTIEVADNDQDYAYFAMEGKSGDTAMTGKLFACTTATNTPNPTWIDIGPNTFRPDTDFTELPIHDWAVKDCGVMDILTDPDTGSKVWVAFGSISRNRNVRVYKSNDAGQSWYEYSDGLPIFPVVRLAYQEGTNDLIYAATDVGVYYRDATMDSWECFSNDLPICQVWDIEIDYCERKLYAATFGRGAWTCDLIEDYADDEIVISSDITWNTERRIRQGTIRITSSGKLTITDLVKMPVGSKIIVEEGGELIVDGGTLTCLCGMWDGVQVWGDPDENQNSANQGEIEMKNSAKIENAHIGVLLGTCDGWCEDQKSGGIIDASNSVFRNCRKSVAFAKYNFNSSASSFTDVVFICDQPMQDEVSYNGGGINAFATIWGRDPIRFEDCKFIIDTDDSYSADGTLGSDGIFYNFAGNLRGIGIGATDSRVVVAENDGESVFKDLMHGIAITRTTSGNGQRTLRVSDTHFDNCLRGVLTEYAYGDRIIDNDFDIDFVSGSDVSYGIYTYQSIDYLIEGNDFDNTATFIDESWGVINNGHWLVAGGKVHDNTFYRFKYNAQAEKQNLFYQLSCNTFESFSVNTFDWVINPPPGGGLTFTYHEIGPQGSDCEVSGKRSGNVFEGNQDYHVYNWSPPFLYNYTSDIANTDPEYNPYLSPLNTVDCYPDITSGNETSCDDDDIDDIPTGIVAFKTLDTGITDLESEMATVVSNLDSAYTDSLLARLSNTGYSNSLLKDSLLYFSPLSDTVLKKVVTRSPAFTYAEFQDIMLDNSPVTYPVWEELRDSYFDTLKVTAYQDTITWAQSADSVRTPALIEREIGALESQQEDIFNQITYLYVELDSTPELIHFLADTIGDKRRLKSAIGVCLAVDSIDWAEDLLDSLYQVLDGDNDTAFYDYYDIAIGLEGDTLTWFDMDSTQKSKVISWANGDYEVTISAQAVLKLVDDSIYERIPLIMPEVQSKLSNPYSPPEQEPQDELVKDIDIYPNPFENSFNVKYQLGQEVGELQIEVFDLLGRAILTEKVYNTTADTKLLNLGDCQGVYIVRLRAGDKTLHQAKIICQQK